MASTPLDESVHALQPMSISFTSPNDGSADDSFAIDDLGSPSPRRASLSVSFSSKSSVLDYSNDVDGSFDHLPISPVSPEDDEDGQPIKPCSDPCSDNEDVATTQVTEIHCEERASSKYTNQENNDFSSVELKTADDQASVPVEASVTDAPQTHEEFSASARSSIPASDCNKRNAAGQSALSISSANGFLEGVKLLVENGADANLRDKYGRCPLHLACENKESDLHHDCVAYLLGKGADASVQDVHGRTPLHIAAKEGCARCIELLLQHGAIADVRNSAGDTPLHLSAQMGHLACMRALSPGVCQDDESHSSVESTMPSLLFDHDDDNLNNDVAGSFYQSPREVYTNRGSVERSRWDRPDASSYGNLRETLRMQNDSGYFTARGSAWVKSKYYADNKIEEERESSIASSTLSDVDGKYESESDFSSRNVERVSDAASGMWIVECLELCLEFIQRVVLYVLRALLAWSKQPKERAKPGDPGYQFAQPPGHVAKAMEVFKLSTQSKG